MKKILNFQITSKKKIKLDMGVKSYSEESIQYSSILIAAAFSIIIFLLSLIKEEERTLFLEIGLLFLLISIFFEYETIKKTNDLLFIDKKIKNPQSYEQYKNLFNQEVKRLRILVNIGHYSFFIGLLYLFAHFSLLSLIIAVCIYFIFRWIRDFKFITKNYKREVERFGSKYIKDLILVYIILFVTITISILWVIFSAS